MPVKSNFSVTSSPALYQSSCSSTFLSTCEDICEIRCKWRAVLMFIYFAIPQVSVRSSLFQYPYWLLRFSLKWISDLCLQTIFSLSWCFCSDLLFSWLCLLHRVLCQEHGFVRLLLVPGLPGFLTCESWCMDILTFNWIISINCVWFVLLKKIWRNLKNGGVAGTRLT